MPIEFNKTFAVYTRRRPLEVLLQLCNEGFQDQCPEKNVASQLL